MADKDLHWIRDWDIISAAADGLFIHSHYFQSPGARLPGIRTAVQLYSIQGRPESTTLTQIHTFTWQIKFQIIKIQSLKWRRFTDVL